MDLRVTFRMASIPALTDELESVSSELHAVDIQIQELTERYHELLQRKSVLTKRIKQCLEDSAAEASGDCQRHFGEKGHLSCHAHRRREELVLPAASAVLRRFYTGDLSTHLSYGRSADGFTTVGDFSYYVEFF